MANVNNPHGVRPLMRTLGGGPGQIMPAHKLVGYGTALFINDVVRPAPIGTQNSQCIDKAITPGTTPSLAVNLIYGAASTATDHIIVLGHNAIFETQIDTVGANLLSANANVVLTAGDATTKLSKHSANSVAATNTLDFRLLGLYPAIDNVVGAYARVLVTFNRSALADQIVGAAGA